MICTFVNKQLGQIWIHEIGTDNLQYEKKLNLTNAWWRIRHDHNFTGAHYLLGN